MKILADGLSRRSPKGEDGCPPNLRARNKYGLMARKQKVPPRLARQVGSEYRCYLSVLTGFSSHTSGGPGGREILPQMQRRVKHILKERSVYGREN